MHHPDKAELDMKEGATKIMAAVNAAYEALKTPESRRLYAMTSCDEATPSPT